MNVILISGHARAGKDCFGSCLQKELAEEGYRTLIIHFADFLKFFCMEYLGWDGQKETVNKEGVSGRELLQRTGQAFRASYEDSWADIMKAFLKGASALYEWVLIPDARYPNEIEAIRRLKREGWIEQLEVIRIERPNYENNLTEKQRKHESETSLDDYPFASYYLNVGGIDTIELNAKKWIKAILNKENDK